MSLQFLRSSLCLLALLGACGDTEKEGSDGTVEASSDADADGYGADIDCDDASALVHPGADERCDGIDNNCDGQIDESPSDGTLFWRDADGDGHGNADEEVLACALAEGLAAQAGDCDDTHAGVHPDAQEVCGGGDEDCDGLVDDADDTLDPTTRLEWWPDTDEDGAGALDAAPTLACATPTDGGTPWSLTGDDCDDTNAAIHPSATEVCDADDVDEDCSGLADDQDPSVDLSGAELWFPDQDEDGFGDGASPGIAHCDDPSVEGDVWLTDSTDCDDSQAAVNPDATETCDPDDVDENCNGLADDADPAVDVDTLFAWFADSDGDGWGDAEGTPTMRCDDPSDGVSAWTLDATDCDDGEPLVHPAATEVCDAADTDEDCSGASDDADGAADASTMTLWYTDEDSDGHGALDDAGSLYCDDPSDASADFAAVADDCDDTRASVSPSLTEVCDDNDLDEDCSGLADDDDPAVDPASLTDWTVDADGDGHGDMLATATSACEDPSTPGTTYVADATDCDDTDASVSPSGTEVCDASSTDEDCDGDINDDDTSLDTSTATSWYVDDDLDGYGDELGSAVLACEDPSGASTTYAPDNTDCDDTDPAVSPGATEIYGDGIDQSCEGVDHATFSCTGYTVPGSYSTIHAAAAALGESSSVETICLTSRTYTENPTLYGNLEIIGPSAYDAVINGHVTIRSSVAGATLDIQGVHITKGVEILDDGSAVFTTTFADSILDSVNQHGVYIERDGYGTPNTTIERCQVYGAAATSAVYLYDYGYNVTDRVYLTVEDSYIVGGQYGIRTAVTTSSSRSPDQTFQFVGNTIESASYGIYAAGRGSSSTTFRIYNNIITNNSRGFYYNGRGNMNNDYNLYYGNSSADFYGSATGGSHRVTTDPGLSADTPPAPTASGSADGAGTTSYTSTTDFWSNPRPSPPSIGAVEPF